MVYFNNLVESYRLFKSNWKIVVPALWGFIMSFLFALIFILMNDLLPLILRDPSGLFVSGGVSEIAKKVSSVLITRSHVLKILLSLAGFVIANFFVGSGLIAIKYSMISDALKKKRLSLRKSFFGSSKYYWRVIEMRVMVFILIVVLSLVLSLPLFLLSQFVGGSVIVAFSVICILLLMRLILLFRYPVLFKDDLRATKALIKSMNLFREKTKYVLLIWFAVVLALVVSSLFFEFIRIVLSDAFYGMIGFATILIALYIVKEIVMVFVNTLIDIYLYISYIKVRK